MEINIESKRHHDKTSHVRFLECVALPYDDECGSVSGNCYNGSFVLVSKSRPQGLHLEFMHPIKTKVISTCIIVPNFESFFSQIRIFAVELET